MWLVNSREKNVSGVTYMHVCMNAHTQCLGMRRERRAVCKNKANRGPVLKTQV